MVFHRRSSSTKGCLPPAWKRPKIFLTYIQNMRNRRTKQYIEAACCLNRLSDVFKTTLWVYSFLHPYRVGTTNLQIVRAPLGLYLASTYALKLVNWYMWQDIFDTCHLILATKWNPWWSLNPRSPNYKMSKFLKIWKFILFGLNRTKSNWKGSFPDHNSNDGTLLMFHLFS